ncbi:hypothetical protein FACS1894103_6810 [Campylobacterota bacterium]|nr:hypothetical protein FACS1894103_6810 [Campylobacterota bacterium]
MIIDVSEIKNNDLVFLDTNFIVAAFEGTNALRQKAIDIFSLLLEREARLVISSIVLAEYHCHIVEFPLLLKLYSTVMPFDEHHAKMTGELWSAISSNRLKGETGGRVSCKDDIKIIAQAKLSRAAAIVTADEKMAYTYIVRTNALGHHLNVIMLG